MISMEIVFQVVHLFMVLVEGLLLGMEIDFILWIPIIQKFYDSAFKCLITIGAK